MFCLTGKQRSSLSRIDFGVNDKVEELDGVDTSETACTKLELPSQWFGKKNVALRAIFGSQLLVDLVRIAASWDVPAWAVVAGAVGAAVEEEYVDFGSNSPK